MKDGIDLATETGLREMFHQEVRDGIIVVIENSSLEVCFLFSFVENSELTRFYSQMDTLLLHLLMIVVMGLVYLIEM